MKSKVGTIHIILFFLSIFCCATLSAQLSFSAKKPCYNSAIAFVLQNNYLLNEGFKWNSVYIEFPFNWIDTTKKKDRDGDGIVDSLDKCPDEKGVAKYDGCPEPDSDNDGIADNVDSCPTIAGLLKYKGCPIPDTDGDKINDEEDKCPTIPGVARYDGCPVGDKDGDGVNDDDDRCIDVPGTKSNAGCPEKKNVTEHLKQKNKKKNF